MMHVNLKKKLRLIFAVITMLVISVNVDAQKVSISGLIKDAATGEPIIGANIIETGTQNGTITNFDGQFTISTAPKATLTIKYVGYTDIVVSVAGKTNLAITMKEDAISLGEVVAIGYGSQTKKEITGSISSVKAEDFNKGVSANPMGLIQGKVAGLTIIKNGGDDPAQNSYNVQLRGVGSLSGSTEPLYVIDGVPGGNLSSVLASDIESMDVLKDGSAAAIYGTRANAGVILITTKRGNKDGKSTAEYSGSVTVGSIANMPRILTAEEYRTNMVANGLGIDYGANTDWIDAITRNPISQTHNLSIAGGTSDFNYRGSVGYRGLQGIAINSDYEEINGRFVANQKAFNKKLDISYDFSYTSNTKSWANYDDFNQAIRSNPTMPIYSTDEKYEKYGGYFESDNFYTRNPVSDINQTTNDQKDQVLVGSVRASLNIIEGLKFSTFYSIQNATSWTGKYQMSTLRDVAGKGGVANQSQSYNNQKVTENTLHYLKSWNEHNFQALLGQSYQTNLSQGFNAYNTDFPLDKLLYNNLGMGEGITTGDDANANVGSYKYNDKLASFFARIMYNYDGRYFLSASTRLEGSSKFGSKANELLGPWGLFPSISGSWNIKEEEFMEKNSLFNDLKLRLGYGVTGNMPGSSYLYAMTVGPGSDYVFSDGAFILPWGATSNINEYIRWEEKHELNGGIDFAILSNRLSGSLDGYFRNTTDLLYEYSVSVPPYPYGTKWDNYGQIHNYGIELQLNGSIIKKKDLNWDLSFNAAWNRNKVVRITGTQYGNYDDNGNLIASFTNTGYISSGDGETGNYVMRLTEGGAIGNYWGWKYYGINSKGEWVFETPAGGYTTNPQDADKMVLGNAFPWLTFGLNSSLRYKEFDLSMNFRGQLGGLIFNETRYFYENTRGTENVLLSSFEGDAGKLTNWITSGSDKASLRRFSDFYLEDATYFKLNDLTIGYTPKLKQDVIKYINDFRIYFTAQNVFTLTGYTGHDPSTVSMSGLTPGFDGRSYYPTQHSFNLGLSFKF
ncbi:MAG: SusC/RagA family TonB-linked outer membrane protein [Paludibacter sp.]|nr:SusC/RagA family TonB-linked outer membrane protein [Paludibacter sp.]